MGQPVTISRPSKLIMQQSTTMPFAYEGGLLPSNYQQDVVMFNNCTSPPRRASLLSVSLYDMPLTPGGLHGGQGVGPGGVTGRDPMEQVDQDPFAPLSIHEGIPGIPLAKFGYSSRDQRGYDSFLTDRSESSLHGMSTSGCGTSNMAAAVATAAYPAPIYQSPVASARYSYCHTGQTGQSAFKPIASAAISPDQSPTAVASFSSYHPCTPQQPIPKPPLGGDTESAGDNDCDNDEEDPDDPQRFKKFHEEKWTLRYNELLQFLKDHGHAAVPHTYPANPQLARWVKRQRRQYKLKKNGKPSTMTTERLEMLTAVGFIWDSHDVNWREKLHVLTQFRAENGHCNVPSNYQDKKLATWVKCQRRQYKLYWAKKPSAMSPERIRGLEGIGFEWEIRATTQRKLAAKPEHPMFTR